MKMIQLPTWPSCLPNVLLAVLLVSNAQAMKCGTFFTEQCLGENDKRYDEDTSIALQDQAEIWRKLEGYFETTHYSYLPNYLPKEVDDDFGIFKTFPYISFTNMTFAGSRGYRHTYFILDPLDDEVPGAVRVGEIYITSTHEKDGSAVTLPLKSDFVDGESDKRSITYPVGDNTMFGIVYGVEGDAESTLTESMTCLDVDCNTLSFTLERFDGEVRTIYNTGTMKRYPDAESWAARVNQAYDEARVPDDLRLPCPMEGDCLSDCVSEEDFCQSGDPLCSESPYQEPDAKMKPSIIAVITIVGFLLVASAFYIVYRVSIIRQGRRYRTKFAQRIADTISVEKSMRSLSPELLAKEFETIDSSNNGRISKEALWSFLSSGKSGEIKERDFEALWTVMDADDTGSVNFLEFCAFLANCHDEYDKARRRVDRGSLALRTTRRMSQADLVARKSIATMSARLIISESKMLELNDLDSDSNQIEEGKESFDHEDQA